MANGLALVVHCVVDSMIVDTPLVIYAMMDLVAHHEHMYVVPMVPVHLAVQACMNQCVTIVSVPNLGTIAVQDLIPLRETSSGTLQEVMKVNIMVQITGIRNVSQRDPVFHPKMCHLIRAIVEETRNRINLLEISQGEAPHHAVDMIVITNHSVIMIDSVTQLLKHIVLLQGRAILTKATEVIMVGVVMIIPFAISVRVTVEETSSLITNMGRMIVNPLVLLSQEMHPASIIMAELKQDRTDAIL